MTDTSKDLSDTDVEDTVNVEECVADANKLKEQGNAAFKSSNYDLAIEEYKKAIERLNKIPARNKDHNGMKSVLHCNLSASYLGIQDHMKAITSADDALRWDPGNKKALYRRALARFNGGYLDEAKKECQDMLSEDANNSNARMLLAKVNEKLKQVRAEQKKAFGSLFNKSGGLYQDRAKETQQRKKKSYDEYVRKQEEKGEVALDMEAWERLEEEEEKKREEERVEKVKAEEEKKRNGGNDDDSPKNIGSSNSSNKKPKQEESDMDEEDQKIIQETKKMGYCYFGKNKPGGNLTSERTPQAVSTTPTPSRENPSRSISSWNSMGTTYEEKDMSSWCSDMLKETLARAAYENDPSDLDPSVNVMEMLSNINIDNINDSEGMDKLQNLAMMIHRSSIKVTSVDDMECDAQIALIRGTLRYMFDFSCVLKFKASINTEFDAANTDQDESDDSQATVYEGMLELSELSSAMEKGKTYKDYMKAKFKDTLKPEHKDLLNCMVDKFKATVCERIDEFYAKYQEQ
ncbi:tetratricopeptide repeat-containing protein protein [Babesia ovis]|uniref:peptidylprolyl isomerase n=1 Tax=Babesia ovis TaxID=5869 RepID=A0A9W5T9D7_BABOV|nr:tetratricopeptide repeat-containing protein protein [Babesia ovis]